MASGPARRRLNGYSFPGCTLLAGLVSLLVASSADAQVWAGAPDRVFEGVRVPTVSVAGEGSIWSMGWNPAGLAMGPGWFGGAFELGDPADRLGRTGGGLFLSSGGLRAGQASTHVVGAGLEWSLASAGCVRPTSCRRRGTLAYAFGSPTFALGLAGRGYQSDESAAVSASWSVQAGALWRPLRWLSLGAVGWTSTVALPTRSGPESGLAAGAAVRPWEPLQLAFDVVMGPAAVGPSAPDVTLAGSVGWSVLPGLDVSLQSSVGASGPAFLGGVRGSFGQLAAFLGGHGGPRTGGGLFAFEVLGARESSLLPAARRAVVVDLSKELAGPGTLDRLFGNAPALDPWSALVSKLRQLDGDRSVGVLVLVIREGAAGLGRARVEELRDLADGVRRGGGRVLAWMRGGGDGEYYLATAADRILVTPATVYALNGLVSERTYLRGALDKLGVTAEFVAAGAFKSAPEQFTRTGPSEAALEAGAALLDDVNARYLQAIRSARGLDDEAITRAFSEGLLLAEALESARLVDGTVTDGDDLERAVAKFAGERLPLQRIGSLAEAPRRWGDAPRLGLVSLEGNITDADSDSLFSELGDVAPVGRTIAALDALADDPSVRAVVLRIDSPGGSVSASERLYAAVKRVSAKKPVVASLGDVAASGGYYIAVGADHIVAEPGTLTGSIGVFAGKADLSPLLDRLGVSTHVSRRAPRADLFTLVRPWSEGERQAVQASVDALYETFLLRVAAGRKLARADVHAVAQGRVWTGAQALERRLVDGLGGLSAAVAEASRRAGIAADDPPVLVGAPGLWDGPESSALDRVFGAGLSSASRGDPSAAFARAVAAGDVSAITRFLVADPVVGALVRGEPLAVALDLPAVR